MSSANKTYQIEYGYLDFRTLVTIKKFPFSIGRSDGTDLPIDMNDISREHVVIIQEKGKLFVKDLGSSNGTFIDKRKLKPQIEAPYGLGQEIQIGKSVLARVFVQGEEKKVDTESEIELAQLSQVNSQVVAPQENVQLKPFNQEKSAVEEDSFLANFFSGRSKANNSKLYVVPKEEKENTQARKTLEEAELEAKKIKDHAEKIAADVIQGAKAESERFEAKQRLIHTQIAEKTQLIKKAEEYLEKSERNIKSLQEEFDELQKYVSEAHEENEELKKEIDTKKKELQKEIDLKKRELQVIQDLNSESEKKVAQATLKVLESEEKLKNLEIKFEESQEKKNKLEAEILKYTQEHSKALHNLEGTREELEKLEKDIQNKKIAEAERAHEEDVKSRKHRAELEMFEAEQNLKRIKISSELEAVLLKKAITDKEYYSIQIEKENLQNLVEDLKKQETEKKDSLKSLKNEVSRTETELHKIQEESKECQIKYLEATQKLLEVKGELKNVEERRSFEIQKTEDLRLKILQEATEIKVSSEKEVRDLRLKTEKETEELRKKASQETSEWMKNLEREVSQTRLRVSQETESLKKAAEQEALEKLEKTRLEIDLMNQRNLQESAQELSSQKSALEAELDQRKKQFELELSELRLKENQIREREHQEAEQAKKRKQKYKVQEIVRGVESIFQVHISEKLIFKSEIPQITKQYIHEVQSLVERHILENESANTLLKNPTLQAHLPSVNEEATLKAKKYWIQLANKIAYPLLIVILCVLFPAIPKNLKSLFLHWFKGGESSSEAFVKRAKELRDQRPKYTPLQDKVFKSSYTDNILYTESYLLLKTDSNIEKEWVVELNNYFVKDLNIGDRAIVEFATVESVLIVDLKKIREAILPEFQEQSLAKMRAAESEAREKFIKILGTMENYQKIRGFEEAFYVKHFPR